jgi:hypothetical protein
LTTSTHKPPLLSYPIYLHIQNFRIWYSLKSTCPDALFFLRA